jgi:outer membrane protein
MLKKIVLVALIFVSMGAMAQDKIAYLHSTEVIMAMPETAAMQAEIEKTQAAMQAEMQILNEEYQKKYTAFMEEGEGLVESIKLRRLQEIQDLEGRMVTFQEQSREQLQMLHQQLITPIHQKVQEAMSAVAEEQGYMYILGTDQGTILYVSPSAPDATPLVKAKLGLQ